MSLFSNNNKKNHDIAGILLLASTYYIFWLYICF